MKKTTVFAGSVASFAIAAAASATPFQGMVADLVNSGAEGDSYRIYALIDSGARVDAVYGNSQGDLNVYASTGGFYQNLSYGGNTSTSINSAFFPVFPSIEWDSYVSIGCLYSDGTPFDGNALNEIGIDWSGFNAGGALNTDNGSWFVTPNDAQGEELNGRVFVGQFTVAVGAEVLGQVNLQGKDVDGVTWNEVGATWVPAPGALALLGLAGIAGRRRRR
jgi:MYXO-CTERM domain-containing protein